MAQEAGWTPGPAPEEAWTPGAAPITPDFRTSNAKDSNGDAELARLTGASSPDELERIRPTDEGAHQVGETIRHLWGGLMAIGQLLPFPKVAGGSGVDHPLAINGDQQYAPKFLKDMHAVKREGDAVWEKGDKVAAAEKYVESIVPLVGPLANQWHEQLKRGEYGAVLGDVAAMFAPHVVGAMLPESAAASSAARISEQLTPEETASNAFAAEHNVPLDAATATGSRSLRAMQKRVANSMGGEGTADALIRDQHRGLTRVGGQLEDQAHPDSVSPEQAGAGTQEAIRGHMRELHQDANVSYDALREIEAKRGGVVDITRQKDALRPLYNDLERQSQLIPLQGEKARALVALDRLMKGPDAVGLTTLDAAVGDLKSMARADIPELRTQGQGAAAAAVTQLDAAVRTAAAKLGPDAVAALETGRSATKAKFQTGEVFDALRAEPVQTFRQMTAPKDAGIGLLRQVESVVPDRVHQVGRAWLEDRFDSATERGRFDHADRLYAEWQKLGPQTKQVLFGEELTPKLDDFFLLAKRIAENPNPSGTAHTLTALNFGAQPVTWGLAKLLYTPRGVKALTKFLSLEAPAPVKGAAVAIKGAVKQAAWIDLATAARAAGAPLELPKAAGQDPDSAK